MFVHVFACKYCINKNICEIGWIVWRTFFKADKVHTVTHRQKRFEMLNKHFKVKCTVNICTCTPLFYFSIYTVWSFYSYAIHFLLCLILFCKHCFWISFLVWYGCCADSEADWRLWRHNLQWAEQFFQHRVVWHSRATGGTLVIIFMVPFYCPDCFMILLGSAQNAHINTSFHVYFVLYTWNSILPLYIFKGQKQKRR